MQDTVDFARTNRAAKKCSSAQRPKLPRFHSIFSYFPELEVSFRSCDFCFCIFNCLLLLTILPTGSFLGSLQLFLGIRDSGLDVRSNFLYFRVGIVHGAFRGNVLRINREIFLGFLQRFLGINEHFRFLIRNNRGTILLPPDRVTEIGSRKICAANECA